MGSEDGFPLMLGWELMVRMPCRFTRSSSSFIRLVSAAKGSSFQGRQVTWERGRAGLGWRSHLPARVLPLEGCSGLCLRKPFHAPRAGTSQLTLPLAEVLRPERGEA